MNRLNKHVDHLFAKYKDSKQVKELKHEILTNLEAKITDLTLDGMEREQAVTTAIASMDTVDGLIDGQTRIYIHKFRLELLQIALLYTLIAWILSIPFGIIISTSLLNKFLLCVVIILGIAFLGLSRNKVATSNMVATCNIQSIVRYTRLAWIIWALFIIASIIRTSALQFGSNLWFGRPIHIDGPYQFAILATPYLIPFLSIIIPLLFNSSLKLFQKYEVGESYED